MNRTNIFIVLGVGLFVFLMWLLRGDSEKIIHGISWSPGYNYEKGKMPYDIDIAVDLLKHEIPESGFNKMSAPFNTYHPIGKNGLYVAIRNQYRPDYEQSRALIEYVKKGNTAFVASESFGSIFKESLEEESSFFRCKDKRELITSAGLQNDSLRVFIRNSPDSYQPQIGVKAIGWSPFKIFYTSCIDTTQSKPVGYTEFGSYNCLAVRVGEGTIYLHSMPVLFANYNLIQEPAYNYLNQMFQPIEYDELFVDMVEYRNVNNAFYPEESLNKTPFHVLFKNRSLRTAFYLILFISLMVVILGVRRLLPPIAIVEKPINSSVAFSKSISRLYWLHPDHKKIALKKVKFFLSEVSVRYGLDISKIDQAFLEKLSRKSGIESRRIAKLFNTWEVAKKSNQIHEDLLKQISESIDYVRMNWK